MDIIFTMMGTFAVVLGLSLLGTSVVLGLRKRSKIKRSAKTTGVVVDMETSLGMRDDSGPRSTLYKPTVRFQTADGRVIEHTPRLSNNVSNYRIGENVPVFYDPQRPEEAIAGTPFRLWYGLFVMGLGGAGFTFIGTMFIVMTNTRLVFRFFDLLMTVILR